MDISRDSGLAGINAHLQEFYQNADPDSKVQDKKDEPVKTPEKDAKDKKDAKTSEKDVKDKKDTPAKTAEKEKIRVVHIHDHDHGQDNRSAFGRFLEENRLTIQIVAGVILAGGIALFVYLRMARPLQSKDTPPPAPGPPQPGPPPPK